MSFTKYVIGVVVACQQPVADKLIFIGAMDNLKWHSAKRTKNMQRSCATTP